MTMREANPEVLLSAANQRLAELLHTDPVDLSSGGARTLRDDLWIWGIVGGKDVGKTTLINALAGGDVVDRGQDYGEGTFQPAAYLCPDDEATLRGRFAELEGINVAYHANAPQAMKGLVLVDLPDFDSLFAHHVDQVRVMAGRLDGIIWVTTPKKVGDLRGVREIRRVLKARTNFAYVVNKMDWLLAQSAHPPLAELERTAAALRRQVAADDPQAGEDRSFLITGKYRSPDAMFEAIARSRNLDGTANLRASNGELQQAVDRVLGDFDALRARLTTAPTAEAAEANKRANLTYQVRVQARQLLEHHQPRTVIDRLDKAIAPEVLSDSVEEFLPALYCDAVLASINDDRRLLAEWSGALYRKRVAAWPLIGIVAWPASLIGAALHGLRSIRRADGPASPTDPFRQDGVELEERVEGIVTEVRSRLAGLVARLGIELPDGAVLARQFRSDAASAAEDLQSAVMTPLLDARPSVVGRAFRWLIPICLLLWFPLVQPVLAGMLPLLAGGGSWSAAGATLVTSLSAGRVLTGIGVTILLYALIAAAVYSRAVRGALGALDRLRQAGSSSSGTALVAPVSLALRRPFEDVRNQLVDLTERLEMMSASAREAAVNPG